MKTQGTIKAALSAVTVGVLSLTMAACSSGSAPKTASNELANGKTFTLRLSVDPGSLDPLFASNSVTQQTARFLYDTLVNFDPDGNVVAGLAQSWQGTTTEATFTLRKNITCSDGSALTPEIVAANINFVGDPSNNSTQTGISVAPGAKATSDSEKGTVTVTTPSPEPFLIRNVGSLPIVCAAGTKDRGLLAKGADGTGMYTVTEVAAGDHYTLTRRKDYAWGPGDWKTDQAGLPDKVVLKVISNETTAANLLLSGEVNAATIIGPDKQRLQAKKAFQRDLVTALGQIWFNQKPGLPGSDEKVRRALTQALKLDELGQVVTSGDGKPATGLIAPVLSPCKQDTLSGNLPGHDLDAAKSALDAAGWKVGANGVRSKDGTPLKMEFFYPSTMGPTFAAGAELIKEVWSGIGVDVLLRPVTDAEGSSLILGGEGGWNAAFVPIGVGLPNELVPLVSGPTPPNGSNFAFLNNAGYLENVQKAVSATGEAGCEYWAAAERKLFEHVDVVPFVNSATPTFAVGATFELADGQLAPSSVRMLR
ncbi:ABC transporter substrate-binding protein [Arthrobacter sp. B2a2-09]|uniref:ABC transporter substrate-binding protein n=1 Tax=Arthrobacter sp. B2a2-09 TaxID=2952822 RepID=UPI0022CD761F|nr:ABC transporter substrate-binding protein [Arthrobacter sp. B2a2-09]MCZ9883189.1 ABC transporter substrate-binding protein [Arthrobacter sp. B2a2-09]